MSEKAKAQPSTRGIPAMFFQKNRKLYIKGIRDQMLNVRTLTRFFSPKLLFLMSRLDAAVVMKHSYVVKLKVTNNGKTGEKKDLNMSDWRI